MIISLDKFKNSSSNGGSSDGGTGKHNVACGTKFALSSWETIPEEFDFSQVTDFSGMFLQATHLKTGLYLDDWSKADDCSTMYQACSSLESVPDMNTSNCRGFMKTFQGSSIVNAPNIDVSNAIRVDFMFDSCPNLTRIGVLDTAHLTAPTAFAQLCTFCPKLTTIEGIDFSGLTAAPILFHQNDSLTNITVNGSISFSWLQYGFGELPNLSEDSVISILSAMARCNNPEETKQMNIQYNYDYGTDISAITPLMEECRSKGWFIGGIQMKVPYVIIDSVSSEVEPGGYVEVAYSVTNDFDHFIALDKITLHIYDDYGYEKDFNINSASNTIFLRDSDLKDPFFRTYVVYGGQRYSGSEYSYTRLEQTEPEQPEGGEPEFNFWLEKEEIAAGDYIRINYEINNYESLGFAPKIIVGVNDKLGAYISEEQDYRIKDSEGYIDDIKDDTNYEPQCIITLFNPDSGEQIYQTTLSWERVASGVFFDDDDEQINIPYTGETQELTIPFNMYGVENYWLANGIQNKGLYCNIEVIEGVVEGYTHALHITVDQNRYNVGIDDFICFEYHTVDGDFTQLLKYIYLEANPDSNVGLIEVSANYENYYELPSSVDGFEILFNVKNAEYLEAVQSGTLDNFNFSFEPTDIEGYTHVAHITYNNGQYATNNISITFSNGYYNEYYYFFVAARELTPDVDTSVWGNPDDAIPVTMAEFIAAEPSTTQWYEIKGKILTAPQVETGKMLIQSIDGDTGQTVYFYNPWGEKGEVYENALFVNYSWNVALMNPVDGSMSNPWFPGDGANIIIRTLKHSYDTNVQAIDELSEDNNGTTIAGQYNGSPCAVYVGEVKSEES